MISAIVHEYSVFVLRRLLDEVLSLGCINLNSIHINYNWCEKYFTYVYNIIQPGYYCACQCRLYKLWTESNALRCSWKPRKMSCLAQIQCKSRDGSRLLCHTICPIHKRFTTALLELQATVHDFPLEGSLVSCQSAWILNPDRNHLKSENVVYTTFVSWNLLGRLPNGIYERLAPYTLQSRSYQISQN